MRPDLDDRAGLEPFADWLALCELLWDYDETLRDRLGFGIDQVHVMIAFVGRVEERRMRSGPIGDPVPRALESIAALQPELGGYARHVRNTLPREAGVATTVEPTQGLTYYRGETFDVRRVLLDL